MKRFKWYHFTVAWLLIAVMLVGGLVFAMPGSASPVDIAGGGSYRTFRAQSVVSASGSSAAVCDEGKFTEYLTQLTLTGTMTGTAPTLAVVIQHSIDEGTTWYTVDTFTSINATVTPAAQLKTQVKGIIANTPVTYGGCWRAVWTVGGTGTVTANIGIKQYRH